MTTRLEPAGKLGAAATAVAVVNGPQDELFDWDAVDWRACERQVQRPVAMLSPDLDRTVAELESRGLLTHPHTSAGRVPTERGYRYFAADVLEHISRLTDLAHIKDGDEAIINAPLDVLGINFYTPSYVSAKPGTPDNAAVAMKSSG